MSKEYRNKKVGTKLVNEIENWAKENGIKKVRVNSGFSRKEAHEFYRSLGYNNEKTNQIFEKLVKKKHIGKNADVLYIYFTLTFLTFDHLP